MSRTMTIGIAICCAIGTFAGKALVDGLDTQADLALASICALASAGRWMLAAGFVRLKNSL